MKRAGVSTIDALLKKGVTEGVFPGAVLLVARADEILYFESTGQANLLTGSAMGKETVFDLASLTKPLATTLVLMRLVQEGRITLTTQLADILPQFKGTGKSAISVEQLLCHTSGYKAYQPYYKGLRRYPHAERLQRLKVLLVEEPLSSRPGTAMCYSDLGFMLLAWMIEVICGEPLPAVAQDKLYRPLGIDTLFFPDCQPAPRKVAFAATERCSWRKQTLLGTVHDDNAAAAKGLMGHAGLFGDARSVYGLLRRLVQSYCQGASLAGISATIVHRFLSTCEIGGRVKGFDTPRSIGSSSGQLFSKKSIGHLGFTGTSFWIDLQSRMIVILLSNRVHPARENEAIKLFRPQIHDCVMQTFATTPVC